MSKRPTGLELAEFKRISALLTAMQHDLGDIANSIGPALGARWCDEGLKLEPKVAMLRLRIEDRFADDHGFIPHVPDPREKAILSKLGLRDGVIRTDHDAETETIG
jgi:hypothetical protein